MYCWGIYGQDHVKKANFDPVLLNFDKYISNLKDIMTRLLRLFVYLLCCLSAVYAQPPATPMMPLRIDRPGIDTLCRIKRPIPLPSGYVQQGDIATFVLPPAAGGRNFVINDTILNWQGSSVIIHRHPATNRPWAVARNRGFTAPFGDTLEVLIGPADARAAVPGTSTTPYLAAVPQLDSVPFDTTYIFDATKLGIAAPSPTANYTYTIGASTVTFTAAGQAFNFGAAANWLAVRSVDYAAPFGDTVQFCFRYANSSLGSFNPPVPDGYFPSAGSFSVSAVIPTFAGMNSEHQQTPLFTVNRVGNTGAGVQRTISFTPMDVVYRVRSSNRANPYVYVVPPSLRSGRPFGAPDVNYRYSNLNITGVATPPTLVGGSTYEFTAEGQGAYVGGANPTNPFAFIVNRDWVAPFGDTVEIYTGDFPASAAIVANPSINLTARSAIPELKATNLTTGDFNNSPTPDGTMRVDFNVERPALAASAPYPAVPAVPTTVANVYDWRSCEVVKRVQVIGPAPIPHWNLGPICANGAQSFVANVPTNYMPGSSTPTVFGAPTMTNTPTYTFRWYWPNTWTFVRYGSSRPGLRDTLVLIPNLSGLGGNIKVVAESRVSNGAGSTTLCDTSIGSTTFNTEISYVSGTNLYVSVPSQPGAIVGTPVPPPMNQIGSPNVCARLMYSYQVPTVTNATSYIWTFQSGTIPPVIYWTRTTTLPQIDNVTFGDTSGFLTVRAVNVCGQSIERVLAITNETPATPSGISGPTAVCGGGTATFNVTAVPGAAGYGWAWFPPAGATLVSSVADSSSITINITAPIRLRVRARNRVPDLALPLDSIPCYSDSFYVDVSTTAPLMPMLADIEIGQGNNCAGTQRVYRVKKGSQTFATSYQWLLPPGFTALTPLTGDSIVIVNGSFSGNLQVRSVNICGVSPYLSIPINVPPSVLPTPTTITGNTAVCPQTQQNYTVNGIPLTGADSINVFYPMGWRFLGNFTAIDTMLMTNPARVPTNSIDSRAGNVLKFIVNDTAGFIKVSVSNACTTSNEQVLYVAIQNTLGKPTLSGPTEVCWDSLDTKSPSATSSNTPYTIGGPQIPGPMITYQTPAVPGACFYEWRFPCNWKASTINHNIVTPDTITTVPTVTVNSGSYSGWVYVRAVGASTPGCLCGRSPWDSLYVNVTTRKPLPISTDTIFSPGAIRNDTIVVCPNSTRTYSVPSVNGALSYIWQTPTGWLGGGTTNSVVLTSRTVVPPTGYDTLRVFARNACGDTLVDTVVVEYVPSAPAQPDTIFAYSNPPGTMPAGYIPRNASGSIQVCNGQDVIFEVPYDPLVTSWKWTVPAGWIITGTLPLSDSTTVPRIQLRVNGPGTVSVIARNDCGTSTSRSLFVNAEGTFPYAPIRIDGPRVICVNTLAGRTVTYQIPPVGNATYYEWTFINFNGTGATYTRNISTTTITDTAGAFIPGSYPKTATIEVRAVNACGKSLPFTITVQLVNAAPATPNPITGDSIVCRGTTLTYSVTNDPNADQYIWNLPRNWVGGSNTNTITATVTTDSLGIDSTGTITVYAVNPCGISAPRTIFVRVVNRVARPDSIIGDTSVCAGTARTFSVQTSIPGAIRYNWILPPGSTFISAPDLQTITAIIGSNGFISVSGVNACGNGDTISKFLNVDSLPVVPDSIIVYEDSVLCGNGPRSFKAYYAPGRQSFARSFTWVLPAGWTLVAGSVATSDSIRVNVTAPGAISVFANNNCGSSAARIQSQLVSLTLPNAPLPISGLQTICTGQEFVYEIPPVPNASSYVWTFPAGWTVIGDTNGTRLRVIPTQPGGPITVRSRNGCGLSDSTRTITPVVLTVPATPGPITGETITCPGRSYTYQVPPVPGATSYTWTLPTGWSFAGTIQTDRIVNVIAGPPGNIRVRANNPCGSSLDTQLVIISSPTAITPNPIIGDTLICSNRTGLNYSIAAIPGVIGYNWTFPAGWNFTVAPNGLSATVARVGNSGEIIVNVINACSVTVRTIRLLVVVFNSVPLAPLAVVGPDKVCDGSLVQYAVNPVPNATTYTWTLPAGWTGTSNTNVISAVAGSTGGTVSVVATNACGSSTATLITVSAIQRPIIPDSVVTRCGPGSVTFMVPSNFEYVWYDAPTGGSLVAQGSMFTTPRLTADTDFYIARVVDGCETRRTKVTARILPIPTGITFTTVPTNNDILLTERDSIRPISFTNTTTNRTGIVSWEWVSNGTVFSTNPDSARFIVSGSGSYIFVLRGRTADGCIGVSEEKKIVVEYRPTGIEDVKAAHNFRIFPNPANDQIKVEFTATVSGNVKFNLYATDGKLVYSVVKNVAIGVKSESVDLSSVAAGNYLLSVEYNGSVFSEKLVIVR